MLSIAICDDCELFLQQLEERITVILEKQHVVFTITKFTSGNRLLNAGFYDIVFLDVEMEGIDGISTAQKLRKRGDDCKLIFLTAHKKYVFLAFDVNATHYLTKPLDQKKLGAVLERIQRELNTEEDSFISIKQGTGFIRIRLKDILFVEVLDRKIFLHTKQEIYDVYEKLDKLEQILPDDFFRCHRSYIIHFAYVQRYDKTKITMENGETVLVSKRKYGEFCKGFLLFLKQKGEVL